MLALEGADVLELGPESHSDGRRGQCLPGAVRTGIPVSLPAMPFSDYSFVCRQKLPNWGPPTNGSLRSHGEVSAKSALILKRCTLLASRFRKWNR